MTDSLLTTQPYLTYRDRWAEIFGGPIPFGWDIDDDRWLYRQLRPGEHDIDDDKLFILHKTVYSMTAASALAFDKAFSP